MITYWYISIGYSLVGAVKHGQKMYADSIRVIDEGIIAAVYGVLANVWQQSVAC